MACTLKLENFSNFSALTLTKNLLSKYGEGKFKIGESDSGRKLKVTLKQYIEYMLYTRDDSPLYLFESSIEDHGLAKDLLKDYEVPKFFRHNLFNVVRINKINKIVG